MNFMNAGFIERFKMLHSIKNIYTKEKNTEHTKMVNQTTQKQNSNETKQKFTLIYIYKTSVKVSQILSFRNIYL